MLIFWRGYGGLLPLLIAVPAVIGGLVGGRVGVATAFLIVAPAIAIWGWRINMHRYSRAHLAELKASLGDDGLRNLLLSDQGFRAAILDDADLQEEIRDGENLEEVVDDDVFRTLVDPPELRNAHTLYALPVQYWALLLLLAAILLLTA